MSNTPNPRRKPKLSTLTLPLRTGKMCRAQYEHIRRTRPELRLPSFGHALEQLCKDRS